MESRARNHWAAIVTAVLLTYGLLLMATTFAYYSELRKAGDLTRFSCGNNGTTDKLLRYSYDFEENFCNKIETWKTCSLVGFVLGLVIVAYSIHSYRSHSVSTSVNIQDQERFVQEHETTIPFFSHLLVGVPTVTLLLMIFLLGSKALDVRDGMGISWSMKPIAAATLFLFSLPSLAAFLAFVSISLILPLYNACCKGALPGWRFQSFDKKVQLASV